MCRGQSFSCSAGSLLCFLVLLQQICAAYNQQTCAPSSCGKITDIRHPFRLTDDPATCGDRRYELACENNRTVLHLFSGKYYVLAINYSNFTIRLLDPGIQEDDCSSIPRYFLSASNFTSSYDSSYDADPYEVPESARYRHYGGEAMFGYVIYLNCSKPVKDDPQYVDTAPCVNWHSAAGHVYAIAGDLLPGQLKVDCHVKLVAMSSAFGLGFNYWDAVVRNHTFSYAEMHRMLISGFEVSWLNSACEDPCGRKQGCGLAETAGDIECYYGNFCVTPLGFDVTCGHPSKLRIFVEGTRSIRRWNKGTLDNRSLCH